MNIYILSLERIESRYTWYWASELRNNILKYAKSNDIEVNVENIEGDNEVQEASSGAFLNFGSTNLWKNAQINKLVNKFMNGSVKPYDKIIFPDAWHPGIIQVKYISDLLDIPVQIHSIWHAGSYDPQDFLGRKVKDKRWSYAAEESFFNASDKNYFATQFHINLFKNTFNYADNSKIKRVGFPFEYIKDIRNPYPKTLKKEEIVLFPHRVSPEKQPEIFIKLSKLLPQYKFIICQDLKLSKKEYYDILAKSKVVFSANLQETLGISCYEGLVFDANPVVPDRLSYCEMYTDTFKYSDTYDLENIAKVVDFHMKNWENMHNERNSQISKLKEFFTMDLMLSEIFKEI
jgi:glycosyltransferase involved in cell wall biosynthesis